MAISLTSAAGVTVGERDPEAQAAYRNVRCHSSLETIRAAVFREEEHIFPLAHSLDYYVPIQAKIAECDVKLEASVGVLTIQHAARQ